MSKTSAQKLWRNLGYEESMSRVPGLDLLRAIAIIWVLLFHGITMGLGLPENVLTRHGWMGVDLFFVLSGFLIGAQWFASCKPGEAAPFASFYARRSFRILPAYAVIVAIYFLFPGWRERAEMQPLWQFATFSANLFADFFMAPRAFTQVWSLCVEEHFYLVFPFIAWALLHKPSMKKTVAFCAMVLAFGIGIRVFIWSVELRHLEGPPMYTRYYEHIYYPTWSRLDGLLMGVVLAMVKTWRPALWKAAIDRSGLVFAAGMFLFALSIAVFHNQFGLLALSIGYPILALALGAIVLSMSGRETWGGRLELPGIAAIATISYSLYLSHKLAFHFVDRTLGEHPTLPRPILFALFGIAALIAAGALHFLVEKPFLKLRGHLRGQRRVVHPLSVVE